MKNSRQELWRPALNVDRTDMTTDMTRIMRIEPSESSSNSISRRWPNWRVAFIVALGLFLGYQLRPIPNPLDPGAGTFAGLFISSVAQAQIGPLDCDSLEDARRFFGDTLRLGPSFARAGDTVDIPFYITNDSVLGGFAFLYSFDTSLLAPVIDTKFVEQCDAFSCDTTLKFFVRTSQTARLDASGLIARGPFDTLFPDVVRLIAIPVIPNVDSIAPGSDTLCYQRFVVREDAELGCFSTFEFITRQVWQVFPGPPPDSIFANCLMNEYATIEENFPTLRTPLNFTGIFRVGTTADIACGDANADGSMNIADVTFLIARIFAFGEAPCSVAGLGDSNCDGKINIADITFLIAHIFAAGQGPCCPPGL